MGLFLPAKKIRVIYCGSRELLSLNPTVYAYFKDAATRTTCVAAAKIVEESLAIKHAIYRYELEEKTLKAKKEHDDGFLKEPTVVFGKEVIHESKVERETSGNSKDNPIDLSDSESSNATSGKRKIVGGDSGTGDNLDDDESRAKKKKVARDRKGKAKATSSDEGDADAGGI